MTTPTDNDRDDALMRRLYDEPDADGADGELAREVESFRQVRSAVAEYARATEVEPPSRGVDELLAAARQRAPARTAAVVPLAAGGGFWARLRAWLAPIAAHPALASAAMVVVVAVVGGVLYVKGRGGVTEGAVGGEQATPAETRSQGSAAVATTDKEDPGMVAGLDDGQMEYAPVTPTPTVQPMTPPPEDPSGTKTGTGTGQNPPQLHSAKPTHAGGSAHKPDKSLATTPGTASGGGDGEGQAANEDYSGGESVAVGQGTVRTDGADDDHAAPVLEPQAPPTAQTPTSSPPPPTAGAINGRDTTDEVLIAGEDPGSDAGKTKSTAPPKRPTGPDVDQLTRQARTAAKSGDCGVVKSIGGKVKKANATYYKQTFVTDATIKKCL